MPRSAPTRRLASQLSLAIAVTAACASSVAPVRALARPADPPQARAATAVHSGFLSVVLGRSLYSKGSNCATPAGMMSIDQVVPALRSLGVTVTAPVIANRMGATAPRCVNGDLYPTWQDEATLAAGYGLTPVSASTDYVNMTTLTTSQQFSESCGSLSSLIAHGFHRAWGLFAYPNNHWSTAVQSSVVSECFAFGRSYVHLNSTSSTANNMTTMAAPWMQMTVDVGGGRCHVTGACPGLSSSLAMYGSPLKLAAVLNVAPGYWNTVQLYSFVTGSNLSGTLQWDCTNANWADHWTNRFEVYCWNDFASALQTAGTYWPSSVVVTDPATVAEAYGRIPTPVVTLGPTPQVVASSSANVPVTWSAPEDGLYAIYAGGAGCGGSTPLATGSYQSASGTVVTAVPTSALANGPNTLAVCLTNDAGHTGGASATVTVDPPPTLSGVSPAAAPAAGGVQLSLSGSGFGPDSTVTIGGQAASVTSVSATAISAIAPAQPTAAGSACDSTGSVCDVTVGDAGGSSTLTQAVTYEAAPSVLQVSPASGPAAGGTQVTITGSSFYPDASVSFGGVPAPIVSLSSSSIVVTSPPGAAVAVDVAVSDAGGSATDPSSFTYY